jgi:hypothetical protein
MTELPPPLVPPDCDLRGYEYMPLFGNKLFGSEFYARANDAEFRAAMRLWWSAWQQCPAGSLPDDDRALALLADHGRNVKSFQKVREVALHGFVKCNDGRLYHPVLCNEALNASEIRKKERMRKAAWRERSGGNGSEQAAETNDLNGSVPRDTTRDETGTSASRPPDVHPYRTGQDRTVKEEEERGVPGRDLPVTPRAPAPLPLGWLPSEEGEAFAVALGLDPMATSEAFRDWYHGGVEVRADWSAVWRTWCRNQRRFDDRDAARGRGGGRRETVAGYFARVGSLQTDDFADLDDITPPPPRRLQ